MSEFSSTIGGASKGASAGAAFGSIFPGFGTAIGAGIGAIGGGVLGFMSGQAQDDAMRERRRAALEEARKANVQNAMTLGEATARAGASGVEGVLNAGAGSLGLYLQQMNEEFRRQNEAMIRAANKGQQIESQTNLWNDLTGIASNAFQTAQFFGSFK